MTGRDELLVAAEAIADGWYPTGPIDWHDFLDRLEAQGFDLSEDMLDPQIKAIKKHVRDYRKSS